MEKIAPRFYEGLRVEPLEGYERSFLDIVLRKSPHLQSIVLGEAVIRERIHGVLHAFRLPHNMDEWKRQAHIGCTKSYKSGFVHLKTWIFCPENVEEKTDLTHTIVVDNIVVPANKIRIHPDRTI